MRKRGYIYAIFHCILAGLVFVVEKILLITLNSQFIIGVSLLIGGLVLIPILPKVRLKREDFPMLFVWILSYGIAEFFTIYGLNLSTAVNGSLLRNIVVISTVLLASLFLKETLELKGKLAVILVISGAVIASTNLRFLDLTLMENFFGNVIMSVGFFFFGVCTIIMTVFVKKTRVLPILCIIYIVLGTSILLYCHVNDLISAINVKEILLLLFMGIVYLDISLIFFYRALNDIGATRTGTITSTIPILGIIYALIILKETISVVQIIAGIIIITGIFLLIRESK